MFGREKCKSSQTAGALLEAESDGGAEAHLIRGLHSRLLRQAVEGGESRRLPKQQEQMARRGKMDEPNLLERLGKGGVSAAGQSDTAHRIGWACHVCRILQ